MPIQETERLNAIITKLEEENNMLQSNLHSATNEKNEMKWELKINKTQLEANEEKDGKKDNKSKRDKECITQANHYLDTVKVQLKQVEKEIGYAYYWFDLATKEKKELRIRLKDNILGLMTLLKDTEAKMEQEQSLKENAVKVSQISPRD